MKLSRYYLIAACAGTALSSVPAYANVPLPTVELRGAGASTVAEVVPRIGNCIGRPGAGQNLLGSNDGSLTTITPGAFNPTTPTATNPAFDCATQEIQPNTELKYLSVGSGTGRAYWRAFSTAALTGAPNAINPFAGGAGVASGWSNVQFAYSEGPISTTDLATYNSTANSAANKAGPAIQIPTLVVGIAVAYAPAYGVKTTGAGNVDLKFNVKVPASINGVVAGGLRLSRVAYCKIFNGEITNWNDPLLKTLNGNTALFDTVNDNAARWTAEGAPIRLAGRADSSGGTDVFTRAMAAQCGGLVAVNKFSKAAAALPYAVGGTIDIRRLLSSSPYQPGATASTFAGTVQSLGGLVYDRVTSKICMWDEVNNSTKRCDITVKGTLTNTPTPGLFMVADTSGALAAAIEGVASNTLIATSDPAISLNGILGYIGADFVRPSPGRTLFSAALQKGSSTAYVMPSAANATAAFGTSVLPPQSTASSGAYNIADARQVGAVDPLQTIAAAVNGGSSVPMDRANPLHWAAALYNPNVPTTQTLANPVSGYPITGVAFMLTSTCFKPADPAVPGNNAKRFAMANMIQLQFGKLTKNSVNTAVSANTFKGTGPTALGIITQSNVAIPSAGWVNAITETFLKKSTQDGDTSAAVAKLGDRNLWIQDGNPTTALDVDAIAQATDQKSNPTCDANLGA